MKAVSDRAKSYLAILTAGRRWSRSTARSLAELLRPELAPGEELPDLVLLQELFARALARRWRRVAAADDARVAALHRRRARRADLDREVRRLYRAVVDLRAFFRIVFGSRGTRQLIVFSGPTSRDPLVLLRQADRITASLRDVSRPLPAAAIEPADEDRSRWASAIEDAAKGLRAAFSRASLAGKELEAAKAELRRELGEFNPLFVRVASWFEGAYHAAGHAERAAAVRPSRWRRGLRIRDAGSRPAGRRGRDLGAAVAPERPPFADADAPAPAAATTAAASSARAV